MTSVTITSKTGKQINLSINAEYTSITATAGSIKFGAEQTASGFKTRFPERINGKATHIEVVCEGAELAKVAALFAELDAAVAERSAADAERQRHHDAVRKMMAE